MKSIDELTAEHNRRMKKIEVEFRQKMSELDEKEKEIGEINKKIADLQVAVRKALADGDTQKGIDLGREIMTLTAESMKILKR